MRAWLDAAEQGHAELHGPLDAPGMDPTWILSIRSNDLEADVHLFLGPYLDVSAFRPTDPDAGAYIGGEDGLSNARLIEMLDDLEAASLGGDLPSWLRPARF
jgi:hypothetical protein